MKALLLSLLASAALGQSRLPAQNVVAASGGVTLAGSQTVSGAKTFSATLTSTVASSSNAVSIVQGARIALGGGPYLYSDGSRIITLASGYFGGTLEVAGALFIDANVTGPGSSTTLLLQNNITDGAGVVAVDIRATGILASATAEIAKFSNGSTKKAAVLQDGTLVANTLKAVVAHGSGTAAQAIESGSSALTLGTATVTFTSAFASAPICTCADTAGSALACSMNSASTTQVVIFGTTTDTINYICIGQR